MIRFLKQFWSGETNGLTAAALIVGASSLASRLVGLLRDRTLAGTFGAGAELDAYYAAFRVPDALYNLLILGALSAGFIPVFAEYLETRDRRDAWRLAEQVLSIVGAVLVVGCLFLALFAPILVPLTVPGFSPEQTEITIRLARIMFLSPFFLGLSAVMGGILQATRRFLAFSIAPVLYNVGIILGTIFLAPRFGIEGVAWGVVFGAFLHFAVQAYAALGLGLRRIPPPSFEHEGVRRILKLMAPRTAGLAVSQMNLIVLLIMASTLAPGSVAVFNLANNLQSFPVGILGISFAIAAFPVLASAAGRKDREGFLSAFGSAARKIAFFILPATALFFLSRAQIVRMALGSGEFSWDDTILTAGVVGVFLISLLAQCLVPLVARAFYALQNTWTPFWAALVAEALNLVLAFALKDYYGIAGLALAFSIATYINLFLLWWQLRRIYGHLQTWSFALSLAKTVVASGAIILAGYPVRQFIGTAFPLRETWQVVLQASAASFVGLAAFILVAWLLKSPELNELRTALTKKLVKQAGAVAGAEEAQGMST
jgi:putative peptidoglycan lipid II flippase